MAQVGTLIIDFSPMIAQLRALNEALANFIADFEAAHAVGDHPPREDAPSSTDERTGPTVNPSL